MLLHSLKTLFEALRPTLLRGREALKIGGMAISRRLIHVLAVMLLTLVAEALARLIDEGFIEQHSPLNAASGANLSWAAVVAIIIVVAVLLIDKEH